MNTVFALAVGTAAGVLSGFGVGGGSLLMLYLILVAGVPQFTAGGINLLYFIACAPFALVQHIRKKLVDRRAAFWCITAGLPTSVCAAFLAAQMDTDLLRRAFGLLLLYIGFKEIFSKPRNN